MLLSHWKQRKEKKYYLFGMGSDFRKLKYPYVWYDILHVCEVLSRLPFVDDVLFRPVTPVSPSGPPMTNFPVALMWNFVRASTYFPHTGLMTCSMI